MADSRQVKVPLQRVEGDLEITVQVEEGMVTDAWSSGLMYRGFENIMKGRGALDGLVITPRICGICTTGHLTAASKALDMISGVDLPPDAVRIRNLAQMTEKIQSDMRHGFLMFAVDFANQDYQKLPLFAEAQNRYKPFKGETVLDVLRETKKILGIIAIIGGQWPHSSYMVPGGIASVPSAGDLLQCRMLLMQYRRWYEQRILGCPLERWLEIESQDELEALLEESDSFRASDLGFYIRFARLAGLDKIGRGPGAYISYGAFDLPPDSEVVGPTDQSRLMPAGFAQGTEIQQFDQELISEHVAFSWFEDKNGGRHPFAGVTKPYASGREGRKYSWGKAPRYADQPAETGPLAQMVISRNPLFTNLIRQEGPSVYLRELARLVRPAFMIPAMETWLEETTPDGVFYASPGEIKEGRGYGLSDVTRGALGHWVNIEGGRIDHYQIITPTAWNASPRDSQEKRGPIEEALIGTRVDDEDSPVQLGHVVRSFDPCLVCTVHAVRQGRSSAGQIIRPNG